MDSLRQFHHVLSLAMFHFRVLYGCATLWSSRIDRGSKIADRSLTDSLKNNPAMGEAELEQVAPGLGAEAAQEGLAGVSEKLGGMGSEVVQGGVAGVSEKLGGLGKL